jgi:RNA polymerase sigma-70 factor, ECF subfamily
VDAVTETFRLESGRVRAALIRLGAGFDLAEDAVQEAFEVATLVWARDGIPERPGAWITTTARRRLIDRLRRETLRRDRERLLSAMAEVEADPANRDDDRLRLIFTCCHPALGIEAQVALTLHSVCGLATRDIAAAFLVPGATLAQRIVRAKRKIAVAGIPFAVPPAHELGRRMDSVLATVYLVFNAGYDGLTDPQAMGPGHDLSQEAIRLGRLLRFEMPTEPEVTGLLALMLLHDARQGTRADADGTPVLLADQDRTLWNRDQIAEGLRLVARAPQLGEVGQYWLQAAIVAEHLAPPTAAERNWHRICALYDRYLEHSGGSPVVALNRAIAIGQAQGPEPALALVEPLRASLYGYPRFHAALADLLARSGDVPGARLAYRAAIDLTRSQARRGSLQRAADRLC